MVILHISYMVGSPYRGVDVVVPQHVQFQDKYACVGILNINDICIPNVRNILKYGKRFDIEKLNAPFNNSDLVVFHEVYRFEYLKISATLRRKGIPYIILPHGELQTEAQKRKHLKKAIANKLLFNKFINGACAIQCLSKRELESTKFGRTKFIGTNGISFPQKCKTSFRCKNIRFTYIGRLDAYHKGLDLLLEGVKIVKGKLLDANVSINMYGPQTPGLYDNIEHLIVENGVGDIVKLHPAVSGKEKEDILLDTDIFVQTSRLEGMPMGILEAMSYGIPCLVTEGTTLGTFISDNHCGWKCETNARSIANALILAITESNNYWDYSQNAREMVQKEFSWDMVSYNTIRAYKEMITIDERAKN